MAASPVRPALGFFSVYPGRDILPPDPLFVAETGLSRQWGGHAIAKLKSRARECSLRVFRSRMYKIYGISQEKLTKIYNYMIRYWRGEGNDEHNQRNDYTQLDYAGN
jgi:hypothetical protein